MSLNHQWVRELKELEMPEVRRKAKAVEKERGSPLLAWIVVIIVAAMLVAEFIMNLIH